MRLLSALAALALLTGPTLARDPGYGRDSLASGPPTTTEGGYGPPTVSSDGTYSPYALGDPLCTPLCQKQHRGGNALCSFRKTAQNPMTPMPHPGRTPVRARGRRARPGAGNISVGRSVGYGRAVGNTHIKQ